MKKTRRAVSDTRNELEQALYALTIEHLNKLAEYIPGPVKKEGTRDKLLVAYHKDPVFSIFGLDSVEYSRGDSRGRHRNEHSSQDRRHL